MSCHLLTPNVQIVNLEPDKTQRPNVQVVIEMLDSPCRLQNVKNEGIGHYHNLLNAIC